MTFAAISARNRKMVTTLSGYSSKLSGPVLRPLTTSPYVLEFERIDMAGIAAFPRLAEIIDVYSELSSTGLPARVDPTRIPRPLMPYLLLLELEPDTLRTRLAGEMVCANHGGELRGRTVHEIFGKGDADAMFAEACNIAASGEPTLTRRAFSGMSGQRVSYVRLSLPLSTDGKRVDRIMNVVDPDSFVSEHHPKY